MPTEPEPVTLAQLARRAAEIVDPDDENADVGEFAQLLEDADEPARALLEEPLDERIAEVVRRIDPEQEVPQIVMAGAIVRYLAHKTQQTGDDREALLRLAARAEFHGDPPPVVADWLVDQGVVV
ncbi:hypothetical protein [Capillimicrobium parvum]|uniref:DUF3775 domain-containing protein n=1 Tax=Capillimicrobium parvum TaxID=2884022 RepID=A0A9E6XW70_9ACTN|nr:hypothetical protein [Capillimicrobium parvum]UGS35258.1 hypothetical protein DSM104329_01645 [Capillimicrobium parvum]